MKNTTAALALAGILAASAVGCSYTSSGIVDRGAADWLPGEDGFQDRQDRRVMRIDFDLEGNPAGDPGTIDPAGFLASGSRLVEYFRRRDLAYDAEAVGRDYGRRVSEACGSSGTLVILIHGIDSNYDETRRSYKLARMQLLELTGRSDLRFLEIYWDGRSGNPLALWNAARETSKWVGLGLRPLLRALDPGIEVRVLTHSRGAAVICSALWDLPLREGAEAEARFEARQKREPAPDSRRTRVAMLVPAMGGEDFEGCPQDGLERVIIGVNPDDEAVTKGIVPAGWFGSTLLGCDPEEFNYVERALPEAPCRAFRVDLSNSTIHAFKEYLLRRPFEERMVPLLFEAVAYQASSTPVVITAP